MGTMVIYDSNYGNTKKVAEKIAEELGARAVNVVEVNSGNLNGLDLLVVGCPINGWRPTEKMGLFLSGLKKGSLKNVNAATFDTRVKLFIHGDAAGKIAKALSAAGAKIIDTEFFFVGGTEGPLFEGELEKAANWAKKLK